ncbi:hypothetical protein [Streptosporangium amethystogenes]|nr:hypothetical protein [Streptosporangium amethystogenes]
MTTLERTLAKALTEIVIRLDLSEPGHSPRCPPTRRPPANMTT